MQKSQKVLVVSSFFPYPTLHGGTFDIWERIKGLHKLGLDIDLLYTDKNTPTKEYLSHVKLFVNDVYSVRRHNKINYLFNKEPLQVLSRKGLEKVKLEKEYDFVILESESVGFVLSNKTLKTKKKIIRVHNNESTYFINLGKSTSNILKKIYFFQEAKKFSKYSLKIFAKVDRLWFISSAEEIKYRKKHNFNKSIHLPPPVNLKAIQRKLGNRNVLFVGSLFMDNNIEGIMWYLNNVHKTISALFPDYTLFVCGSIGSFSKEFFIKKFSKYKNIKLFFNLSDLEEVYASTSLFINPMLHGAGVKLKSINAIINGLPLVSTSIGVEGIGLVENEMFYLTNTKIEYIDTIKKIFNSNEKEIKEVVKRAQIFLESNNYIKILKKELFVE